jgi:hypothetical protein
MKKTILLTLLAFCFGSLSLFAQRESPAGDAPPAPHFANASADIEIDLPTTKAVFKTEKHDFKKIKQGEVVSYQFKVKNTGTHPLKIYNVKPSCGCTTPDWTKEEIAPGKFGYIEVQFDSAGKRGIQKKSVTVTMNTEPQTKVLSFEGEVLE